MPEPGGLPGLKTIDGFDSLQEAMFVHILGNPNLSSLGGLADASGLFGGTIQLNASLPLSDILGAGFENLYKTCGNLNDPVECDCGTMGSP